MTTDAPGNPAARLPGARALKLVLHALLSGAFLVAYATGDEDTYAMHLAAGYLALVVLGGRLGLGLAAARVPMLRLPRPGRLAGLWRRPGSAMPWLSVLLLGAVAVAGLTGICADQWPRRLPGRLHEALGEIAMLAALGHMLFAAALWLRGRLAVRVPPRVLLALALAMLMVGARPGWAGPAQERLLERYQAEALREEPAFAGFSAQRGRALYLGPHAGGASGLNACAACHTPDPTRFGQHAKTGREIEPMAVGTNPARFTDAAKVEKRFSRDCPAVLGRDCTAREKGDFLRFLSSP
jgi:cytochrome c553